VQSDKAAVEITSRYAGTVRRLCHPPGAMVQARRARPPASAARPLTHAALAAPGAPAPQRGAPVKCYSLQVGEALLEVEVAEEPEEEAAEGEPEEAPAVSAAAPQAAQPQQRQVPVLAACSSSHAKLAPVLCTCAWRPRPCSSNCA